MNNTNQNNPYPVQDSSRVHPKFKREVVPHDVIIGPTGGMILFVDLCARDSHYSVQTEFESSKGQT
jgi:hypothetical protein